MLLVVVAHMICPKRLTIPQLETADPEVVGVDSPSPEGLAGLKLPSQSLE